MSTEIMHKVEENSQLVGFAVGREEYGVDIRKVHEIIRMVNITKIPNAPDHIEGIINLRGLVIPVIDFRKRFRTADTGDHKKDDRRIVVVDIKGKRVGLIVDRVTQVVKLDGERISPPPDIVKDHGQDYIGGIGQLEEKMVIILSMEELLGKEELVEYSKAA
jgi:purine-binding chemotaxis protein CheW